MKKMNQTEIKAVAKKILKEVNEVNKVYNDTIINSQPYKDEIERIKNQNPLIKIREDFKKQLKIVFGTNYEDEVSFSLSSAYHSKQRDLESTISDEVKDYKDKVLKPLYLVDCGDQFNNIIEEITIAQITVADIQLLINSIKSIS